MTRLKKFRPNRLMLTIAAILAVTAVAVGGTYANFTATPTTVTSNAFTSGVLP